MKRLLTIAAIAIVGIAVFLVLGIERVPEGREVLRISRDGELATLESGYHWVPPARVRTISYPVGDVSLRCPETGTFDVLTQTGDPLSVAFTFDLSIPPGSSRSLYEQFSEHFESAFEKLVVSSAEIIAAALSPPVDRTVFATTVTARVRDELARTGITVSDGRIEGAERAADAPPTRLVIIGVDGGDWLNLKPLIDAGRLPNFARLVEQGASGPLRSEQPLLSPLLWTTMATGRYPEEHGILNFTVVDPETGNKMPISRLYRRVDAFWNIVGDYGRTACIVGWLATDPPETINGVMVTDKVGYLAFAPDDTTRASSVSPAARQSEVESQLVHAADVTYEEMSRLLHVTREEFNAHRKTEFDQRDPIANLVLLYASTMSYRNIGLRLLESDRPDVLAVYFEWVDAVSHLFMLHTPPRMPDVPESEFEKYKDVVEQAYIIQDEILGDFLDAMDENTTLFVISDHGFKSGVSRLQNRPEIWAGNAAKWHRMDGIVAFYGNGVSPGRRVEEASILDVAPTVLALQGTPRAANMPGKVLSDAFSPDLRARFDTTTVASLDRERADDAVAGSGAASEETMKKLGALGYVNADPTPDNADALNNLGQRYEQRGEYEKAIAEYKKAIALRPDFHIAYNNLAVCYGKLKRYDEAEAALRKVIELEPRDFYAMNNLAVMYIHTRQLDRAVEAARMSVTTEPGYVNGRITLGSVLAMTGDLDGAEEQFREALRLEPGNTNAQRNLERLAQQREGN